MPKIHCDNKSCKKHKCVIDQTFVIIPKNRQYSFAFMRTAHCPVCGKHYTLITNFKFVKEGEGKLKKDDKKTKAFGSFKPEHRIFTGKEADDIFEKIFEVRKSVLYEIIKNSPSNKSGFYLNYSEYGIIKKCYSNLSTLRLGRIKSNFEDIDSSKKLLFI